jgi:hypothetical protein
MENAEEEDRAMEARMQQMTAPSLWMAAMIVAAMTVSIAARAEMPPAA